MSVVNQIRLSLIALIVLSAMFYVFPQIDILTASQFYHARHFVESPVVGGAQSFLHKMVWCAALFSLVSIFIGIILKQKRRWVVHGFFIASCFALGPGLLVNTILKNHWGRPRPQSVMMFSGPLTYQRVWVKSDQCDNNCSFVAGDSSAALAFLAFAFLPFRRRWLRRTIAASALGYFAFNGVMRVIHGAHFISDVVIGGLLVYLVILGCYQLYYRYFFRAYAQV